MRGAPAAAARVAEADFDGLCYSSTTPLEGLTHNIRGGATSGISGGRGAGRRGRRLCALYKRKISTTQAYSLIRFEYGKLTHKLTHSVRSLLSSY